MPPPSARPSITWSAAAVANGLIGDPTQDDRYTYGHGFAMLFLSQVLGEEEDAERREQLVDVLTRAVEFTGRAQTTAGGWGYVSAKDGSNFDEGSTTITQVQGLRGCRNAGIPVPKEIIDKAVALYPQLHQARRRRAVQLQRRRRPAGRSPPPPSPACSTPATTTTSTSPSCWTTAATNLDDMQPGRTSATGIMPTTITPRCFTARGARNGTNTATRSPRKLVSESKPARGRWNQGRSARSSPRPST